MFVSISMILNLNRLNILVNKGELSIYVFNLFEQICGLVQNRRKAMKNTRNLIVEKAIELFKAIGYEKTTVAEICKECGITKGTFYYHFPNKDEIIFAYYERLFDGFMDIVPSVIYESNAKEQLWKVLEYSIDNTISLSPELLKAFLISDITRGMEFFSPRKTYTSSDHRKKQHELQIQIIQKGQLSGEIKEGNPEMMLRTFISALIGIAMDWASNGGLYDEKEELRMAFDVIF